MPRASRYLQPGYTYHLTHRCHDRRFLLKFVCDRDAYRKWLHEAVKRYSVDVYGFCVTSNHVHLIVHVNDTERIGKMMGLVAGSFAQQLNRRKRHDGSVWEHPYQCTIIQDGQHLLDCLRYVSLNMVRAGVVAHPSQWRWCSHDELMGQRLRYRILNIDRLLESLSLNSLADLQVAYSDGVDEKLERRALAREAQWTEALAVGDKAFVERTARSFGHRHKFEYSETDSATDAWVVREAALSYNPVSLSK
jgi:putative transposase